MNIDAMIRAALAGGREVMRVYSGEIEVELKADKSPLTEADRRSHEVIEKILGDAEPDTPVLSEEGAHAGFSVRSGWGSYYLIDPLDGTKEFIKRNGEFTVNVAWVARDDERDGAARSGADPGPGLRGSTPTGTDFGPGPRGSTPAGASPSASGADPGGANAPALSFSPRAGIVYAPDLGTLHVGVVGFEAWRVTDLPVTDPDVAAIIDGTGDPALLRRRAEPLPVPGAADARSYTIVASRSHMSPETEAFITARRGDYPDLDLISAGSSLKLCRVAEGSADEYPRFAPTMEWDTAAGDAVARAAGCEVVAWKPQSDLGVHGRPLTYNKQDLHNPWYLVTRRSVPCNGSGGIVAV